MLLRICSLFFLGYIGMQMDLMVVADVAVQVGQIVAVFAVLLVAISVAFGRWRIT